MIPTICVTLTLVILLSAIVWDIYKLHLWHETFDKSYRAWKADLTKRLKNTDLPLQEREELLDQLEYCTYWLERK